MKVCLARTYIHISYLFLFLFLLLLFSFNFLYQLFSSVENWICFIYYFLTHSIVFLCVFFFALLIFAAYAIVDKIISSNILFSNVVVQTKCLQQHIEFICLNIFWYRCYWAVAISFSSLHLIPFFSTFDGIFLSFVHSLSLSLSLFGVCWRFQKCKMVWIFYSLINKK